MALNRIVSNSEATVGSYGLASIGLVAPSFSREGAPELVEFGLGPLVKLLFLNE